MKYLQFIYEFWGVCVLILLMQKAITYSTYILLIVLIKMDNSYITYDYLYYSVSLCYLLYLQYCNGSLVG